MPSFVHTLKFKISIAFSMCMVLMLIIGGSALVGIKTLSDNGISMFNSNMMPIMNLSDVRASVIDIRLQLRRAQAFHSEAVTQEQIKRIDKIQTNLLKSWDKYYPDGISSAEEEATANRLSREIKDFLPIVARILEKMQADQFNEAIKIMEEQMGPLADSLENGLVLNREDNTNQANTVMKQNIETGKTILWSMIICITIGFLLSLLASIFIMRTITRPLQNAITVANKIADGHLENDVTNHSRDEFKDLLGALIRMDSQLTRIVKGIKNSSATIATASGEIAAGNLDLSGRTEAQASSLEQTASAMEQLTATVKQNSESAHEASKLASTASQIAINGGAVVEEVITTMSSINESSRKIVDIIAVIDGIAFQTNILALNAAVEAARAGEQGRGFAVVATEVRNLAQRSAAAAKEIKQLIDDSVQRVDIGSKLVANAGITMREVVTSVKSVSDIVSEISSASQEQASGIDQVNQAVAQMDEVTQQNAALVEQAAAAAQSLNEQAGNLEQSVRVFALRSETDQRLILEA
jgi:methyl-accepting chemotaxis protein